MGQEQRRHPRRSLDVKVNYAYNAIAHAKDISFGGICLITDQQMEEKKMYTLQFTFPGEESPIALHGKVAWTRKSGEHHFENGITFWRVDKSAEEKLVDYLKKSPLKD